VKFLAITSFLFRKLYLAARTGGLPAAFETSVTSKPDVFFGSLVAKQLATVEFAPTDVNY
jgi:hypothetical protein